MHSDSGSGVGSLVWFAWRSLYHWTFAFFSCLLSFAMDAGALDADVDAEVTLSTV